MTPAEHRRLDEATADALRSNGGLAEQEYPTAVVQVVETRGWDDAGREYANFHVIATDGATRRQVVSLLRDALELVRPPLTERAGR